MNKIYRTVYNETTNTWVAVEETAKSHRKSSGGVVDCSQGESTRHSGSLKIRGLTVAVAMALLTPICAYAELSADEEAKVRALINSATWTEAEKAKVTAAPLTVEEKAKVNNIADFKQDGNNATTFAGGTITGGNTSNSVAFAGGTVSGVEKAVAWGGGTATEEKSTAWGENTLASGNRSTAWGGETQSSGNYSTAWGVETQSNGISSTTWGTGTYAGGFEKPEITEETLGKKFQTVAQLCDAVGGGARFCKEKSTLMEAYNWYLNSWSTEEDFREAVGFVEKGVEGKEGKNATAFGKNTIAGNDQATAFGTNNKANGVNSSILGGEGNAIGQFDDNGKLTSKDGGGTNAAILGGSSNKVSGENAATLGGESNLASGKNALASGQNTQATGQNSFASGENSVAEGKNSFAIGEGSYAGAENSFAVGGGYVDK